MDSRSAVKCTHPHDRPTLAPCKWRRRRRTEPNNRRNPPPRAPITNLIFIQYKWNKKICKRYFRIFRPSRRGLGNGEKSSESTYRVASVRQLPRRGEPRKLLTVRAPKSTLRDSENPAADL